MIAIDDAITIFINSFSYIRSFKYPYTAETESGISILHDNPLRGAKSRSSEIVILPGVEPQQVIQKVAYLQAHPRIILSVFSKTATESLELKNQYKNYGYRLVRTLPMLASQTTIRETLHSQYHCVEVTNNGHADMLRNVLGHTVIKYDTTGCLDCNVKIFYVELDQAIVGWVRSIRVHNNASYISDMNVSDAYRRRGIGQALLHELINCDNRDGITHSVLLSTALGANLYRSVGYTELATMQMFTLKKPD